MKYALFGSGRVGTSMAAWLRHLGHEVRVISRAESDPPTTASRNAVRDAAIIAAAIPDSALTSWRQRFEAEIGGRLAIHFSGALLVPGLWSYHPLCSFPRTPLPAAAMGRIAFARQHGAPSLEEAFPGAPNSSFVIADADRPYYHGLAVLSGTFATHLWIETARAMAGRLGLDPAAVLAGYLEGIVARFLENPFDSLTGPVARRDRASVLANLKAFEGDPKLYALYRAYLTSAWPEFDAAAAGRGGA